MTCEFSDQTRLEFPWESAESTASCSQSTEQGQSVPLGGGARPSPEVHYDDDAHGPSAVAGLFPRLTTPKMRVATEVYPSPSAASATLGLFYSFGPLSPKVPLIPGQLNQISMSQDLRPVCGPSKRMHVVSYTRIFARPARTYESPQHMRMRACIHPLQSTPVHCWCPIHMIVRLTCYQNMPGSTQLSSAAPIRTACTSSSRGFNARPCTPSSPASPIKLSPTLGAGRRAS